MNHLINSLKVEMRCPTESMAFNVRHHFAQNMQAEMIEVMEKICTRYSAENQWLRIDKLEIDVGLFESEVFDKNFKIVFAKQFEKILVDKINNIPFAEKQDTQIKSLTEAVRHFLLNGVLPWWIDKNEFELKEAVSNFLLLQNNAPQLFFTQQKNNPQLWQRVAMQLNNDAKKIIIQYFEALQTAQKMLGDVLQFIIRNVNEDAIVDAIATQENINNWVLKSAVVFFSTPLNESLISNVLINGLSEVVSSETPIFNTIITELNKRNIAGNDLIDKVNKINLIENNPSELILPVKNTDAKEIEKYLVQQAGIVLLSPFFKPFFTNLKLLEAGKWISKEAQIKAVYLLYFISTGLLEVQEYNAILEKVICGLPISFPIPLKVNIKQAELEECDSLITSAIEHWDVLKATSVQGFRQTFLQREGILKPNENTWLLQVERKTLDVLLEKIPWGFNTIFLPWLQKIINIEW